MINVLPKDTILGRLRFFEIYDDFFGPKCFSVKDELDHLYLVYWSGDYEDGECTKWVYMPVSQTILDELLREEYTFNQAFAKSKRLMIVSTYSEDTCKATMIETLSESNQGAVNLPPVDFSIDIDEVQSIAPESQWDFNLRIAKRTEKNSSPSRTVVTQVLDAFGEIIEYLMKGSSKSRPTIIPLTAKPGSFDVKLGASDHERAAVAIELLESILADVDSIEERLEEFEMEPYRLKDLLDIVNLSKLELTLKAKTSETLKKPIIISSSKLQPVIEKLEQMSLTIIDSRKVPQANDLDKLIDIVKHRVNGGDLIHEQIKGLSSARQVRYYTHAAECLGLLNKNLTISSPGRVLAQKNSRVAQYQFLADRVECSDFGWAWMKWAKVSSLSELDPCTAEAFIKECVKGLRRGTIPRRAGTLETWLNVLKEHRREYADLPEEGKSLIIRENPAGNYKKVR